MSHKSRVTTAKVAVDPVLLLRVELYLIFHQLVQYATFEDSRDRVQPQHSVHLILAPLIVQKAITKLDKIEPHKEKLEYSRGSSGISPFR